MSDTPTNNSQGKSQTKQPSSQSSDLASLRKSNRPKKPSLLYADGFEDTQKVIGTSLLFFESPFQLCLGRKLNNPKAIRTSSRPNDTHSASEKEPDSRMEEETGERGFFDRIEYNYVCAFIHKSIRYEDDDEYLPFVLSENNEDDPNESIGYVAFKIQAIEESNFPHIVRV